MPGLKVDFLVKATAAVPVAHAEVWVAVRELRYIIPPVMENPMKKKMENKMEARLI